jgi:hypothetical protein
MYLQYWLRQTLENAFLDPHVLFLITPRPIVPTQVFVFETEVYVFILPLILFYWADAIRQQTFLNLKALNFTPICLLHMTFSELTFKYTIC